MRSESMKVTVGSAGSRWATVRFRRISTARYMAGPNGSKTHSGACREPAGARLGRLLTAALLAAGIGVLAAVPAQAQDREGDLRIVPATGDPAHKGRLEIFHDNAWGGVCDDLWGKVDATVACRQLGYQGAENRLRALTGPESLNMWLRNVQCNGSEESLLECVSERWGPYVPNRCRRQEFAGVQCQPGKVTPRRLTVNEGATATYTIELLSEPSADVTVTPVVPGGSDVSVNPTVLTFTTMDYNQAQTVTVTAGADTDRNDDVASLRHNASGGGYGSGSVPGVTVTVKDNNNPGVAISPQSLTIDEGDSTGKRYTVALTGAPTANVTVTIAGHSGTDVTVSPSSLTFTTQNWRTPRSVTVTAAQDSDQTADNETLTHSASGGGYTSTLAIDPVAVRVLDDDIRVDADQQTLDVDEGRSATYALKPEGSAWSRMTVSVEVPSGSGLTASPSEVTFTQSDWSQAQTITVTAAHDADTGNPAPVTITHSVEGSTSVPAADSVTVNVRDDDWPPRASIDDGGAVEIDEGGTGSYRIRLASDPGGAATVTLSAPSALTVSPTSLSFDSSSWARWRTITVQAPQEDNDTTDETLYVTHTVSQDGNTASLDRTRVKVADDDDGEALVGPRPSNALWWAALTVGRGAQTVGHVDYTGPADVGKLSDDGFSYGGVAREIDAVFVDDGGHLQLWVDSGNRSQLPNAMVLHVGGESMTLGSASRQSFGTTHTDGTIVTKRDHAYWWRSGSHSVSLSDRDVVAVWLERPTGTRGLPGTPAEPKATPKDRGAKLRWEAPEEVPGKQISYYEYQQEGKDGWARTEGTETTKDVTGLDNGQSYRFRVRAVNSAGKGAASAPTEPVTPRVNAAPTGLPTVAGTARVGETLTASSAGISDDDGLTNAVFAWQWVANDGTADTDIADATAASYTLTAAEAGKTVKVRATFTDDGGTEETLTSAATAAVASGLTASFASVPASHDGSAAFTLRVAFSEAISTGFRTMRDDAFEVAGGTVRRAKRVDGRSDLWQLTVKPSSDAPVTLSLPAGRACNTTGAVCTSDDERLSVGIETTVPGPAPALTGASVDGATLTLAWEEALDEGSVPGVDAFAVTVAGAARGVTEVSVRGSTATLTLAAAVAAGETVTVGYTVPAGAGASPIRDATGNPAAGFAAESVTNATGAGNTAPTGLPAISGIAAVGETLTASSSGIADDDGLTNATFAWQWIANDGTTDADIAGATGVTYTLTAVEAGNTIRVRATFTDDGGTEETLTSAATAAVESNLTASFSEAPSEHDGSGAFEVRVLFSEALAGGGSGRRIARSLALSGATRGDVRRVDGRRDLYRFQLRPSGNGAVTVSLASTGACGGAAAVCTSDGRALSNVPEATIAGPPSLSVADAEADEDAGAVLAFTVSLSRAASGPVTVDYATSDVTATAGRTTRRRRGR